VLVVLISTSRTKDILHVFRALVESCLGNCFSHFGFWKVILTTRVEEREDVSASLLLFVIISSILNIVNLFTENDWSISFISHSMQNTL